MATFRSFVEIEAWQKARELTGLVYVATRSAGFSKDFALRNQVRRASISIMANIAEGFGRSGSVEFIQSWRWPRVLRAKLSPMFMLLSIRGTSVKRNLIG
jgi:23S rRNA-intervening sequence protein